MQLLNQIAANTTNGKLLLGTIPVLGVLHQISPIHKLFDDRIDAETFEKITHVFDLALSILTIACFVSTPLSKEKKALFGLVSSLIIASPFALDIVEKFGGSLEAQDIATRTSAFVILTMKVCTIFIVSLGEGFFWLGQTKYGYAFSANCCVSFLFLNKDILEKTSTAAFNLNGSF